MHHIENDNPDMFNKIASNTEHTECCHRQEKDKLKPTIPSNECLELYDIGQDICISLNSVNIEHLQKPRLPDSVYRTLVNSLNKKQKEFTHFSLEVLV